MHYERTDTQGEYLNVYSSKKKLEKEKLQHNKTTKLYITIWPLFNHNKTV